VVTGSDTESGDVVVEDTDSQPCSHSVRATYLQIKVFRLYGVVNIP
jgi:hypothetical protein